MSSQKGEQIYINSSIILGFPNETGKTFEGYEKTVRFVLSVLVNMVRKLIIIALAFSWVTQAKSQDILLTLTGKEVPCIIEKVDTFFVFYTSLGPLKAVEKSSVLKITPQKLLMKGGSERNVVFDLAAYDVNGPYLYYREKVDSKRKDRYNYFSCTTISFDTLLPYQDTIFLSKREKVLYAQDSLHKKFEFSIEEQRAYTYGRRSARRNFVSPWSTIGGVATGFFGGFALPFFYGAGPAVVYCSINASIKPKMGATDPQDADFVTNDYFIEGYRSQAQLLKVQNSVLGAIPALAVGIVTRLFIAQ